MRKYVKPRAKFHELKGDRLLSAESMQVNAEPTTINENTVNATEAYSDGNDYTSSGLWK